MTVVINSLFYMMDVMKPVILFEATMRVQTLAGIVSVGALLFGFGEVAMSCRPWIWFDGNIIPFENSHIEVLRHIQGDTEANTMLWIPGPRILVGGDVVFNGMHVYTAETASLARGKWLHSLNAIRAMQPRM
jgi:glyoxylase-like metal-dependent hydrolase (beta-lactamase superfamily II)